MVQLSVNIDGQKDQGTKGPESVVVVPVKPTVVKVNKGRHRMNAGLWIGVLSVVVLMAAGTVLLGLYVNRGGRGFWNCFDKWGDSDPDYIGDGWSPGSGDSGSNSGGGSDSGGDSGSGSGSGSSSGSSDSSDSGSHSRRSGGGRHGGGHEGGDHFYKAGWHGGEIDDEGHNGFEW